MKREKELSSALRMAHRVIYANCPKARDPKRGIEVLPKITEVLQKYGSIDKKKSA